MRRLVSLVGFLLIAGCSVFRGAGKGPSPEEEARAAALEGVPSGELLLALAAASNGEGFEADDTENFNDDAGLEDGDSDDAEVGEAEEDIGESREASASTDREDVRYTRDLTDADLLDLWQTAPEKLGSISVGFVDEGRLLNPRRFPDGDGWIVVSPDKAYATQETIDYVIAAIRKVKEQYPDAPALRVNQLSVPEGGYLRPHKSHQNGRDVDLGFYYPTATTIRARARERVIHPARNWALVKALLVMTDVQYILVDRRIQRVLYRHALRAGENKAWLNALFRSKHSPIRHARGHRDHFHVRFYNPRAQELARRLSPLFAFRPEMNVRLHRVRKGETLARIARRYGLTITAIKRANRLKGSMLRVSRVLKVPTRGACTRCPVPPPVVLPARRFPPGMTEAPALAASPSPVVDDAVASPSERNGNVTPASGTRRSGKDPGLVESAVYTDAPPPAATALDTRGASSPGIDVTVHDRASPMGAQGRLPMAPELGGGAIHTSTIPPR